MKNLLLLLIFTASFTSCSNLTGTNYKLNDDIKIHEYKLDNGLTVMLVPNKKAPLTNIVHWVKAGSLHEKNGTTGIAHLFEHMMFRPLKGEKASFAQKAKKLGASINANTRFGSTPYITTVPTHNLKKMLKMESKRFRELEVTDELLDIERKAVWSEYSTKMDSNPVIDLWETFYRQGYKDHPYGWMIIGHRADLNKINAKDCNEFFAKYYKPNNIGLVISGDIDITKTKQWVQKYYGTWKAGKDTTYPQEYSQKTGVIKAEGNLKSKSRYVLLGHRTPKATLENYQIQEMANYILYGANFSILNREFNLKNKVSSYFGEFNFRYDSGSLKFIMALNPGVTLDKALKKVKKMKEIVINMPQQEFDNYKTNFQIKIANSIQRNSNLADMIALGWGKYGNKNALIRLSERPMDVTKEDLNAFLNKYFVDDNMIVITNKEFKDK